MMDGPYMQGQWCQRYTASGFQSFFPFLIWPTYGGFAKDNKDQMGREKMRVQDGEEQ